MAANAAPAPEDDRTPLDDLEEVSEQIDQWEAGLKNQPGEPSARVEIRNWLLPILRRLCGIIDGVATDLVEEMDERMDTLSLRVDEVSGLARAVAGTAGMSELLANVHVLCQRILAADLGEETQEMATAIQEATAGHFAAVFGAQAAREAQQAPANILPLGVPTAITAVPSPSQVVGGGFSGVITMPGATAPAGTTAPAGDVIPTGSFDTPASA